MDVVVGGQLRYFRLVVFAVTQVPLFEILLLQFVSLDFDVEVTVRSEIHSNIIICNRK